MLCPQGRCSSLTSLKTGEEGEGKMKGKHGGSAPVCFGPHALHYCDSSGEMMLCIILIDQNPVSCSQYQYQYQLTAEEEEESLVYSLYCKTFIGICEIIATVTSIICIALDQHLF